MTTYVIFQQQVSRFGTRWSQPRECRTIGEARRLVARNNAAAREQGWVSGWWYSTAGVYSTRVARGQADPIPAAARVACAHVVNCGETVA